MSYLVLARKYRPETFHEILGQDHITQTFLNAFKNNRIAHAYLFCGPRGVGKTTTARVLAKALNCLSADNVNPCNQCTNCLEISSSRSMDVIEIDGASNRGIDEMRNLRDVVKYSPINSKYKVFIIDEVHMLTQAAFNALLKTLEEPPRHVKFIFATTESNKVLPTIMSRCQRHDFHRISIDTIKNCLNKIAKKENFSIENEVFTLIGNNSDGSMRDALSLTDQLIAFCGNKITMKAAVKMLRIIPVDIFFQVTDCLITKDRVELLKTLNKIYVNGFPLGDFTRGFNKHLLNLLISAVDDEGQLLDMTSDLKTRYNGISPKWNPRDIIRILDQSTKMESELKYVEQPKVYIEVMMLKLVEMDSSVDIEYLINKLSSLKVEETVILEKTESVGKESSNSEELVQNKSIEYDEKLKKEDAVNKTLTSTKKDDTNNDKIHENQIQEDIEVSTDANENLNANNSSNSSSIVLEVIIENWSAIISKVSESGTSIGTFLSHGEPIEVVGSKIVIGFPKSNKFQIDVLKKNSIKIEKSIASILKKELRVDFIINQNKVSTTSELTGKNLVTKKMLEVFGGDLNS